MQKLLKSPLFLWFAITSVTIVVTALFMPLNMAFAVTSLVAAIAGTILLGEERIPLVVGGLVILLAGGVLNFHDLIMGMEWVLFIKLVALLTWVDFLSHNSYFDMLIERYLPRNLKGFSLLALLLVLASFSAALIDEVNSIILWYVVIRAIIGFTSKGQFRLPRRTWIVLVILLVSATNIGSQFLPLGNPVGIAVAVISGLTPVDFIRYAWVPALITLGYFLIRVYFSQKQVIQEFSSVTVEEKDFHMLGTKPEAIEVIEYKEEVGTEDVSEVHEKQPPFKVLSGLFIFGIAGLIFTQPIASALGLDPATALGAFVLILFAVTLYIAGKFGEHNEVALSRLPFSTLFFIVFLFGIAHALETTGLTEVVSETIYHTFGENQIAIRIIIILIGSLITAVMDNVIAIAILAPIITSLGEKGLETTGLWFTLLAVAVVAGNLTPIGSAANIIANARIKTSWGVWWKTAGMLAIECILINTVSLYIWEMIVK